MRYSNPTDTNQKPKMLFISQDYSTRIVPNNLEPIITRIDNWLGYFFEVTQISHDCSLKTEIELHRPDIILFDGFVEGYTKTTPKVTDCNHHLEIPRAGLCRQDSWSPTRACLFDYFDHVGADAIFVLGDTTMGHTNPGLADRIFYIPQFIDPSVYRDYGLYKSIPVLLVGNFDCKQYPWRLAIRDQLLTRFPTTYFRHPGYTTDSSTKNPVVIHGKDFAKTVNSSLITPTSGGFKPIALSKHVEIPGARSCLVSDKTPGVEIFGFENMRNCVLADSSEAPDAVDYLLRNRDTLESITQAGFELVHSRHTLAQRGQLRDWLKLKQIKGSSQKIIQPDHFGPLQLVSINDNRETIHLGGSLAESLLAQGDELLWSGDLISAELKYRGALALCDYMAEPRLRLAIALLLQGKASLATTDISLNISWLQRNQAHVTTTPAGDPVDIAYLLITILCLGHYDDAIGASRMMSSVRRTELDRARWAVLASRGHTAEAFGFEALEASTEPQARSLHNLKPLTFEEQIDLFISMLEANNQIDSARNLSIMKTQEIARRARPADRLNPYVSGPASIGSL